MLKLLLVTFYGLAALNLAETPLKNYFGDYSVLAEFNRASS